MKKAPKKKRAHLLADRTPAPVGAPSLYKPEYCDMLVKHLEEGLSFESFGAIADVGKQTLYNWAKEFPEFLDAKSRGESKARIYWERVGRDGLYNETIKDGDGMTVTRSINATIWVFNMKNRFGWRDKMEVSEGEAEGERPLEDLSDEELLRMREQARRKK